MPESSEREELEVSSGWLPRLLKAWLRWRTPLLVLPPATAAAAVMAEEEQESKLRGPSCSGTFLISMLSLRSMRGTPEPSTTATPPALVVVEEVVVGESGEEAAGVGAGVCVCAVSDEDDLPPL